MQPEILYAEWQGHRTCCAVVGDGPHEVLVAGSFVSHLDLLLAHPSVRSWIRELARYARITMYDKLGVGLSDPVTTPPTLEDRLAEIRAVRTAAGLDRPVVLAVSEGANAGIAYAALHPDEMRSLVLASPFVGRGMDVGDWATESRIRESFARYLEQMDVAFRPTPEALDRLLQVFVLMGTEWGTGRCLSALVPSLGTTSQLALLERSVASPGMVQAVMSASTHVDGFALAEKVQVPTLILHARADIIPIEFAHELAARIPGADLIEIPGRDHAPWLNDEGMGSWGRASNVSSPDMPAALSRTACSPPSCSRTSWGPPDSLRTRVTVGGDRCSSRSTPSRRPRWTTTAATWSRAPVTARILDRAGPSQALVSRTVRDLVAGADLTFASLGEHELRGVPGTWEVLAVTDQGDVVSIDTTRGSRWYDRPMRAMARLQARRVNRTRDRSAR